MDQSRREDFLKRISTVGTGTREAVQMLLGSVVADLRDLVVGNAFTEDEFDVVQAFHDDAEHLWRLMLATTPPLEPAGMVAHLARMRDAATGPLAGFRTPLDRALEKARLFEDMRRLR